MFISVLPFRSNATSLQENIVGVVGGKELLLALGFTDEGPKLKLASKDGAVFSQKMEEAKLMLEAAVKQVYDERHGQEKLQSSPALRPDRPGSRIVAGQNSLARRTTSPITTRGNSPGDKASQYRQDVGKAALSSRRAQKDAEVRADEAHKAAVLAEKQAKVRAIRDAQKQGKDEVDRLKAEKQVQDRQGKDAHKTSVHNAKLAAEQEELERQISTRDKLNSANASKEEKRLADEDVRRAQAALQRAAG